jgi:hypothetical protein
VQPLFTTAIVCRLTGNSEANLRLGFYLTRLSVEFDFSEGETSNEAAHRLCVVGFLSFVLFAATQTFGSSPTFAPVPPLVNFSGSYRKYPRANSVAFMISNPARPKFPPLFAVTLKWDESAKGQTLIFRRGFMTALVRGPRMKTRLHKTANSPIILRDDHEEK